MFFLYLLIETIVVVLLYNFNCVSENVFDDTVSSINFFNEPDPCKNLIVKCESTSDCDKCLKKYSCVNGHCVRNVSSRITCDETRGVYPILIKSDGIDSYKCVSLYPLYFNENGIAYDHMCKNGTIHNVSQPTVDDRVCTCDRLPYVRKIFVQSVPVCVMNDRLY